MNKQPKNRWKFRAMVLMMVSAVACMSVSVLATVGTSDDPLVTLSYLQQTFWTSVVEQIDSAIGARDAELNAEIADKLSGVTTSEGTTTSSTDAFTVVTLTQGQVLYGDIGCEVMLRVGTATCVASASPGLINQTDGTIIYGGDELAKNDLCMMTIEDRGVKATAATVKLMVRGDYWVS
ncbi:hypothetical protein RFF05_01055 [Bengtsoniella intestinalis]|uniref:hypothetical protein n=1 Tax=Bengtsoniella intestinalis TaxID=3073143 RepID=UPI00391F7117